MIELDFIRPFIIIILLKEKSGNVVYNSTYAFSDFSEEMKKKRMKRDAKLIHIKTGWVLCSEDWQDIVIMYLLQLNNIPIENNYTAISLEEIKDAYLKHGKWRKPHKKRVK